MARIEKFEDLVSWQKARVLTQCVYQATKSGAFVKDYGLRDQVRRAAVSILSNIAEGFERGGDKEFQQFLSVAKGSCAEVRAQLYVALDEGYIETKEFEELRALTVEISRLISGMMTYLANSAVAGRKFKAPTDSRPKTSDSRPQRI
jgi:four helix bundle protein